MDVEQITESSISSVVAMLPASLQSGIGPIRFLRRSISLHTLRPGVLISEREAQPEPEVSPAPRVTEVVHQEDVGHRAEAKAVQARPMKRVLYSEAREDERPARAASGVHWKFARQGRKSHRRSHEQRGLGH